MLVGNSVNKREIKMLGKDVRFVKSNADDWSDYNYFFGSSPFWILLTLPLLLTGVFAAYLYRSKNNPVAGSVLLSRKAHAMAKNRLKHAATLNSPNNYNAFFEEIFKAVYGYIADGFSIAKSDLNRDKIALVLQNKKVDEVTVSQLMQLLDECELARFSPSKNTDAMNKVYNDSIAVISSLEKYKGL